MGLSPLIAAAFQHLSTRADPLLHFDLKHRSNNSQGEGQLFLALQMALLAQYW